jgi:hypothetical protein
MHHTSHAAMTPRVLSRSGLDDFPDPAQGATHGTEPARPSIKGGMMRTRADLTDLHGFSALTMDTSGNPCVWRNIYVCGCLNGPRSEWESDWSCQCDDECPGCGASCSPHGSTWLGPADEQLRGLWENLPEAGGEA